MRNLLNRFLTRNCLPSLDVEGAGCSAIPGLHRGIVLAGAVFAAVSLGSVSSKGAASDTNSAGKEGSSCPVISYFEDWFVRVDKTRAEQPKWSPPISTVSPALQEVLRYDVYQQSLAGGHTLVSYGGGKGLEFIPAERVQFIIGIPAYQTVDTTPRKDGWADQTFLMKYRFLSANAENGDYVLTGFMGLSVPNGSSVFTTHHFVYTPTIAFGKGWGDFDVQSTLGISVPDGSGEKTLGTPLALNVTAQYRVAKYFWPEVEANYTWWPNGTHEGLNQLFITPGLVLGRFPVWGRLGLMVGAGCQVAVTDNPLYHRNIIVTGRLPF
jgi:hypothetical protein